MDDKAFDKLLANKLNGLDEYPFQEDDWQSVHSRLNQRRPSTVRYWLIALLLLPLLSLNGWLGYQWHTTQQRYEALQSTLHELQQSVITQSESPPDIIYQQTVVHHYDTVYRTIIRREVSQRMNSEVPYVPGGSSIPIENNETTIRSTTLPADQTTETTPLKEAANNFYDLAPPDNDNDTLTNKSTTLLPVVVDSVAQIDSVATVVKKEKKRVAWQRRFRVGSGAQLPRTVYPNTSQVIGVGGGIDGSLLLTERLALVAHVHYIHTEYTLLSTDEPLGIKDILSGSIYQNDELQSIQNRQSQWQWGGGVQYRLTDGRKWTPFVSLNYLVEIPRQRNLTYSLREVATGKLYIQERVGMLPTFWHIVDGELGIERPATNHLVWQMGGFYNVRLSSQQPVRLNQIGLRTRLYYQF